MSDGDDRQQTRANSEKQCVFTVLEHPAWPRWEGEVSRKQMLRFEVSVHTITYGNFMQYSTALGYLLLHAPITGFQVIITIACLSLHNGNRIQADIVIGAIIRIADHIQLEFVLPLR